MFTFYWTHSLRIFIIFQWWYPPLKDSKCYVCTFVDGKFYGKKRLWILQEGKVFQHVIPAAVLRRVLLTFLSSDSQASCSLTWVGADFHSIVPSLPFSAILFPVQNRKSCLQLFPALWTKELLAWPHTCTHSPHTHTHTHTSIHTSSSFMLPLSLCSGCPSLMWRWPPGKMGWSQEHVSFPFPHNIIACT